MISISAFLPFIHFLAKTGFVRSFVPTTTWSRSAFLISKSIAHPNRHNVFPNLGLDTNDVLLDNAPDAVTADTVRPLHQNWWPVTLVDALDPSRPNAIELLGMRLVLFCNGVSLSQGDGEKGDGEWTCLDDRCSHRFAPLSEGRVLSTDHGKSCLQCAYHGWEFNDQGTCTRLPQANTNSDLSKAKAVQKYPVREAAGMLWVWSDPLSSDLAKSISLPISTLLSRYYDHYGDGAGFMRDLPYGVELLGENLLDLSHLPFSHHSVASLRRTLGGPLPLRMLSFSEKGDRQASGNTQIAMFQAEVVNAGEHDPIMLGLKSLGRNTDNATCTIAFFDPAHVRYERVRNPAEERTALNVELFMCPTAPGNSRVILFNVFESLLPSNNTEKERLTSRSSLARFNPFAYLKKALMARLFQPQISQGTLGFALHF